MLFRQVVLLGSLGHLYTLQEPRCLHWGLLVFLPPSRYRQQRRRSTMGLGVTSSLVTGTSLLARTQLPPELFDSPILVASVRAMEPTQQTRSEERRVGKECRSRW